MAEGSCLSFSASAFSFSLMSLAAETSMSVTLGLVVRPGLPDSSWSNVFAALTVGRVRIWMRSDEIRSDQIKLVADPDAPLQQAKCRLPADRRGRSLGGRLRLVFFD